MRRVYSTEFKLSVMRGECPSVELAKIPKSTRYRWMKESETRYYNGDMGSKFRQSNSPLLSTFISYGRLVQTLRKCFADMPTYKRTLLRNKVIVVQAIQYSRARVCVSKAVKLFGISVHTFYAWQTQVGLSCGSSVAKLCLARHPLQLTRKEVERMEELVHQYPHWSIASIHHFAIRNNIVVAGLATWYKYNQLLHWRKASSKRKIINEPLRATRVNQFWHMDVTLFRTGDGTRHYIHVLMDNFSRKVLAWELATKLSGATSAHLVKKAITFAQSIYPDFKPQLVVDGGSENCNRLMDNLLSSMHLPRLVAQRDIRSSNSMVEAKNKTIKNVSLYRQDIQTTLELGIALQNFFLEDDHKPLHALKGLAPDEVYCKKLSPSDQSYELQMQLARETRKEHNYKDVCGLCL